MKWKRIPKENSVQPDSGVWRDWKAILAEEASFQCVYCAIHESCFGGTRNFHVEHYRPKSKPQFKKYENDIKNLFYACAICNTFKGSDWPESPHKDYSNASYPDPSKTDYNEIFESDSSTGEVRGRFDASKYMIEKIYLNRPQLIIERRLAYAYLQLTEYNNFFRGVADYFKKNADKSAMYYLSEIVTHLSDICDLQIRLRAMRPYKETDIKRKKEN